MKELIEFIQAVEEKSDVIQDFYKDGSSAFVIRLKDFERLKEEFINETFNELYEDLDTLP